MNLSRFPHRSAAALAAALVLVACSSKEDRIESGLVKGAEFVRAADWDKAGVEVRNVLQIDPKNARAYLIGAQVAEGKSDVQRAYRSYLKAVELDPALVEAHVGLARVYLLADERAKARAEVNIVLQTDPAHPGALTIKAALTARDGDERAALIAVQDIVGAGKAVPVDAHILLASLLMNRGEAAKALEAVDRALKANPNSLPLLQVAAQVSIESAASVPGASRAPEFLRRAAEAAPREVQPWASWAQYHIRRAEFAQAESVLRASVKANPDDSRRRLDLVKFVAQTRGNEVAEKELRAMIDERGKDTELRFGLVNLLAGTGRELDAQAALKAIVEIDDDSPAGLQARRQLAGMRLAAGRTDEARNMVAEVLKANPRDNGALVLRGRLALREGRPRDAIVDLRAAARDQPGSAEVIGLLAVAHNLAGEPQLAREALTDAVKNKPEQLDLRLLLVGLLSEMRDHKAALAEIDAALKQQPTLPRLYELKAQALLAMKDTAGAEQALKDLRARVPDQAVGYLRLGQFYAEQKRLDVALATYDAGVTALPADLSLPAAGVGVLVAQQKFAEIESRLAKMSAADPKNPIPHRLRGEVALLRKDLPAAEAAYRQMVALAPKSPSSYIGLARAQSMARRYDDALATLGAGDAAVPGDALLVGARAELLTSAGRTDEAIKVYQGVIERSPGDESAANNLGYLLADVKGDPASLKEALRVLGRFSESSNPSYLDSLGWVHYKLGEYDKALPLLERAAALNPGSVTVATHLGMTLVKAGQVDKGKEILGRLIAAKAAMPSATEARQLAGVR